MVIIARTAYPTVEYFIVSRLTFFCEFFVDSIGINYFMADMLPGGEQARRLSFGS
jgi:hypothetical protein